MKISIFPRFGASNSSPVFQSFCNGAKKLGYEVVEHDQNADAMVIWSVLWHGKMKNNQEIWNFSKKSGKKIIVLEVGGLFRGKTWRVGLNHINNLGFFGKKENYDLNRPKKLGIFLKTPQKVGDNILICGQHSKSQQWVNRPPPEKWLVDLVNKIKKHSDRKIVFRPHPRDYEWCQFLPKLGIDIRIPKKVTGTYDDFDHDQEFLNAWCVFNPCSNTGIQAAIAGIPVFTEFDSLAYPVSNKDFSKIENPEIFNKENWLLDICHTEWMDYELEEGYPLRNFF